MKKIIIYFLTIFLISCGPFVDEVRISGSWKLEDVEFYEYKSALDSIKVYTGTSDPYPDEEHPIEGNFFCASEGKYIINFETDNTFTIKWSYDIDGDETEDILVDSKDSKWTIDTFENSLYLKVKKNSTSHGFWRKGFEIKCYWPLSNYEKLEILIKARDVDKDHFDIDLTDDELEIDSMKGIFKKD